MPPRRKTTDHAASEFCSAEALTDFSKASQRIEGIGYGTESETDKERSFSRCRYFSRRNDFIREVLRLRRSIYNHGLFLCDNEDLVPSAKLRKWMEDRRNRVTWNAIRRFAADAWHERFVTTNVISLWREGAEEPMILNPEDIEYSDRMGIERLTITHCLRDKDIDSLKISKAAKDRLKAKPKLELTHDDELFRFEVLKDEKLGQGLGWPDMQTILLRASSMEAHEIREAILAGHTGRQVIAQWKIGHETRYGVMAGTNANFAKAARQEAIRTALRGKIGLVEMAGNFDQELEFPAPGPEHWDGKRYASITERMLWWALPLGHMIVARAFNPNLMPILEWLALDARDAMRPYLESVINQVWGGELPGWVSVDWDRKILKDPRVLMQLIQNGLNTGPVSQETYLTSAGLKAAVERENKRVEAALDDEVALPRYDGNHGPAKEKKTNGKPAGTKDKS